MNATAGRNVTVGRPQRWRRAGGVLEGWASRGGDLGVDAGGVEGEEALQLLNVSR